MEEEADVAQVLNGGDYHRRHLLQPVANTTTAAATGTTMIAPRAVNSRGRHSLPPVVVVVVVVVGALSPLTHECHGKGGAVRAGVGGEDKRL